MLTIPIIKDIEPGQRTPVNIDVVALWDERDTIATDRVAVLVGEALAVAIFGAVGGDPAVDAFVEMRWGSEGGAVSRCGYGAEGGCECDST